MKSIMQEASSISKAIDQAWQRAGNPTEFSVKILETPERNIIGFTIKSAKIALFFDEKALPMVKSFSMGKAEIRREKTTPPQVSHERKKENGQQQRSRWNGDMIRLATDWIRNTLNIMGLSDITFNTTTSLNGLTFKFNSSITGNELKNRLLFSSFSHLLLATLRQRYKKPFRNLKIILITE